MSCYTCPKQILTHCQIIYEHEYNTIFGEIKNIISFLIGTYKIFEKVMHNTIYTQMSYEQFDFYMKPHRLTY
jgi:hypothetical protein